MLEGKMDLTTIYGQEFGDKLNSVREMNKHLEEAANNHVPKKNSCCAFIPMRPS